MSAKTVARGALLGVLALPLVGGGCARMFAFGGAGQRAEAQYREGMGEEARGNVGEAEDCYEDALDYDPNHARSLGRLAQIKTDLGRYHEAIPMFERLVKVSGGSADAHNDLAYCYQLAGYAEAAEASYRQGIAVDPAHARLRTNYGVMLARQGRLEESMLQLRAVMSESDAHHNVAMVLRSQGKHAGARREFRLARGMGG